MRLWLSMTLFDGLRRQIQTTVRLRGSAGTTPQVHRLLTQEEQLQETTDPPEEGVLEEASSPEVVEAAADLEAEASEVLEVAAAVEDSGALVDLEAEASEVLVEEAEASEALEALEVVAAAAPEEVAEVLVPEVVAAVVAEAVMEETSFDCSAQEFQAGYYADVEARCQVFHICQADGRRDAFLCPVGTIFNQKYFVCDWWQNVQCDQSPSYYNLNGDLYKPGPSWSPHGGAPPQQPSYEQQPDYGRPEPPQPQPAPPAGGDYDQDDYDAPPARGYGGGGRRRGRLASASNWQAVYYYDQDQEQEQAYAPEQQQQVEPEQHK
ncbi:cuticular protein, putative [Ixodes scapularis]|uniref:Cuticular protein, putative n=1 Tax=Ixodes scapularis TaxID=6945 RepID=B7QHZ2_IXOSC|nr:cuticular protein, putative [Ixodes scapularis]|eukprot:XP_002414799.1 cuticular protein, putative [Ixodes scapularis]